MFKIANYIASLDYAKTNMIMEFIIKILITMGVA